MTKRNFAFDKTNFILMAISMLVVVFGFILMASSGSDDTHYNPAIFSTLHIKVAPVVCFIGFVSMIYAVIRKPKDHADEEADNRADSIKGTHDDNPQKKQK